MSNPTTSEFHGLTRKHKAWGTMVAQAEAENVLFDAAVAEVEAQIALGRSVVARSYKAAYKTTAIAKGHVTKAKMRSCNDWLALQMQRLTLDEEFKLVVPAFEAILDANGVKHAHWNRTTPGWQGRLRMTGGIALRAKVADAAELKLPDGASIPAPESWVIEVMGR